MRKLYSCSGNCCSAFVIVTIVCLILLGFFYLKKISPLDVGLLQVFSFCQCQNSGLFEVS